jgi:hypothetical protein
VKCLCPTVDNIYLIMKIESKTIPHCTAVSCIRQMVDKKTASQVAWTIERTCRLMNSAECPHYGHYTRLRERVEVEHGH